MVRGGIALPQAFPFLLIDRIVERVPGEACTVEVAVTGDAFQGQRPGPLPAPLLVEMLCQACALIEGARDGGPPPEPPLGPPDAQAPAAEPSRRRLAALREFRFERPAEPGERLTLTVRRSGAFGRAALFAAHVRCEGVTIARGELILGG